jgi:streptomycin 6-kinase
VRVEVSEEFRRRIVEVHGAAGTAWLGNLPQLVEIFARRWQLDVGAPYALSYSCVMRAAGSDGRPLVLKLALPGENQRRQTTALAAATGNGMVRLVAADPDHGVLLLERAVPGTPAAALSPSRDDEATVAIATVMRDLHRPAGDVALPDLATYLDGFVWYRTTYGDRGPLPDDLVTDAHGHFGHLLHTTGARVLLHGDLHHDNVLAAPRRPWLAIDPHGVTGDPLFECAAALQNPRPVIAAADDQMLAALTSRRVASFAAELGADAHRIAQWGFAQSVLSEIWSLQDHGGSDGTSLRVAQVLRNLD